MYFTPARICISALDIFVFLLQVFSEGDDTVGTNSSLPTIEQDSMDSSQLKAQIIAQQAEVSSSPLKPVVMEPKMPQEPPQHLNGSNKAFDPVVQQEMEVGGSS